jgi:hypothetical protein
MDTLEAPAEKANSRASTAEAPPPMMAMCLSFASFLQKVVSI